MNQQLEGLAPDDLAQPDAQDNITDWALGEFQARYNNPSITKDDIWFYIYGVMHAPDWRATYAKDLRESLPRVPMAPDFTAFRNAGQELMDLHTGYETCPEFEDVVCLVNGQPADADAPDGEVFRITDRMRWAKPQLPGLGDTGEDDDEDDDSSGKGGKSKSPQKYDKTRLVINKQCELTNIPLLAHEYTVSGRSPLEWEVDSLRHKEDTRSGITDDPNTCEQWADNPFELIRHLRRLVFVSVRSAEIIAGLPASLNPAAADAKTADQHATQLEKA